MIDEWCGYYDKGEFPPGEHTTSVVLRGRPPLSQVGTTPLTVKLPTGMKAAIEKKAAAEGLSVSADVRGVFSEWLLQTAWILDAPVVHSSAQRAHH